LGEDNDKKLRQHLFDNQRLTNLISQEVVKRFYQMFCEEDAVYYSHSISMLLTLSLFSTKNT